MSRTNVRFHQSRRLCYSLALVCFFLAGVKSQGVEESASMAGRLLRSFVDTAVVGLSNTSVSHGDTGPRDGSRGKPPGGDEAPKVIDAVSPLQGAAPLPSTTVGRQFSIGPEVATGAPVPTQLLLNNVQSLVSSEGVLTNVEEKPSAPVRAPSIEPLPAILSTPKQNKAQSLAPTSPLDEGELATLGEKSSAPLRAPSIEPLPAILSPPKQLVNPVVSLGEPVSAPAPLESLLSEIAASGPQPSTESVLTVDALAHRPVGPVIAGPSKTTPVSTPPAALIVGKGVKATDFAHVEGATSKATDGGDGDVRGFASMRGPAVSVDQQTGSTSASHSHFGTWFAVCIGVTLAAGILAAAAIKLLTIRRAKRQQEVLPLVQETEMTLL